MLSLSEDTIPLDFSQKECTLIIQQTDRRHTHKTSFITGAIVVDKKLKNSTNIYFGGKTSENIEVVLVV